MAGLRDEFLLDRDVVFLNHGAFGACPRAVFDRYQAWQRELERRPVEFLARRLPELLGGVRERLAGYVGARDRRPRPRSERDLGRERGRAVASPPTGRRGRRDRPRVRRLNLMWRHSCEQAGARYVRAELPLPLSADARAVADSLLARVTDRTRALFFSHVTSPTALVLPVAEIARRAREAGVTTIVDGAHGPGHVPVDLGALGVDVYAGNCHNVRRC